MKRKKKKITKKVKKTKRGKKPRKMLRGVPLVGLSELEMKSLLHQKIEQVRAALPQIKATGKEVSSGGEAIWYTEAHEVIKLYAAQFNIVGLVVRPSVSPELQPELQIIGRGVAVLKAYFDIVDTDTGYSVTGWAFGIGANLDWSGNTAQTRALKQFLLMSFGAYWTDPEQRKRDFMAMLDAVPMDKLKEMIERTSAQQEMEDFYEQNVGKEGKDGKKPKRSGHKRRNSGR